MRLNDIVYMSELDTTLHDRTVTIEGYPSGPFVVECRPCSASVFTSGSDWQSHTLSAKLSMVEHVKKVPDVDHVFVVVDSRQK